MRALHKLLAAVVVAVSIEVSSAGPFTSALLISGSLVVCGAVCGTLFIGGPITWAAVPAGCAACVSNAMGVSLAGATTCLDGASTVMTKDGAKRVMDVVPGDIIATLNDNGVVAFTSVVNNMLVESSSNFTQISFGEGRPAVNVTDEHIMVVDRGEGFRIDQAAGVRVGDTMLIKEPNEDVQRVAVNSTQSFVKTGKWVLQTHDGTALINGILMTTICEDNMNFLPKDYFAGMQAWRAAHSQRLKLDPEHIKSASDFVNRLPGANADGAGRASLREVIKAAFNDALLQQDGDGKSVLKDFMTAYLEHMDNTSGSDVAARDKATASLAESLV